MLNYEKPEKFDQNKAEKNFKEHDWSGKVKDGKNKLQLKEENK